MRKMTQIDFQERHCDAPEQWEKDRSWSLIHQILSLHRFFGGVSSDQLGWQDLSCGLKWPKSGYLLLHCSQ